MRVDLAGEPASEALAALDDILRGLGFVDDVENEDALPDGFAQRLPSIVDRGYRHKRLREVGGSVITSGADGYMNVYFNEVSPSRRIGPDGRELLRKVVRAVEDRFGTDNVEIVKIHRSVE